MHWVMLEYILEDPLSPLAGADMATTVFTTKVVVGNLKTECDVYNLGYVHWPCTPTRVAKQQPRLPSLPLPGRAQHQRGQPMAPFLPSNAATPTHPQCPRPPSSLSSNGYACPSRRKDMDVDQGAPG